MGVGLRGNRGAACRLACRVMAERVAGSMLLVGWAAPAHLFESRVGNKLPTLPYSGLQVAAFIKCYQALLSQ